MSSVISLFEKQQRLRNPQNLTNLPRFNKQFIGIGHHLQQKKKQRRKIEEQQRALANRVIFLQKQQIRAQKNIQKKKFQLNRVIETVDRNNYEKQEKQRLRKLRQLQLQALRQQNRHRRLSNVEMIQSAKYEIQSEKHNDYERIKQLVKIKEQQKKEFLFQDLKNKKDQWTSLNIEKQRGKYRIDKFYKKKNIEHTKTYLQKIQKQELTKQQKINTIKHLQQFQTALKRKLQESTMKVSQVQQRLLQASRTLEPRVVSPLSKNGDLKLPRTNKQLRIPKFYQSRQAVQQLGLNISFQKEDQTLSEKHINLAQRPGYLTQRNQQLTKNNDQEIQEKIQKNLDQIQMGGFQIIRTTKKKRKNIRNRYKQYQLF